MMLISWKGYYCYSLEFDENEKFGFEIEAQFRDGSFTGEFSEEEFTGITGKKGTIKGFIDHQHISFVKRFPFKYDELEDGSVLIDETREGHEVVYDGYFNHEKGIWEGEWEILVEEIKVREGEYELILDRGCWQMKRVTKSA